MKFLIREGWEADDKRYHYLPPCPPPRPFATPKQIAEAGTINCVFQLQFYVLEALLLDPNKPMKKLFKNQRHAGKGYALPEPSSRSLHSGFGDVHVMRDLTFKKKKRDVAVKRCYIIRDPLRLIQD